MRGVDLKAAILGCGLNVSETALAQYGYPFLVKRRAYGNQDPVSLRAREIPQEIYVGPEQLITAVNVNLQSPWLLDFRSDSFVLVSPDNAEHAVSFPSHPRFYDAQLRTGQRVSQVLTLYGGSSLGVFAYGRCDLDTRGVACQYCSIGPNRAKTNDFVLATRPKQLYEALTISLNDPTVELSQVMLNGGNFPDMDRSFQHYVRLAECARAAINASGRSIPLHMIVFPPRDLELLDLFAGLDVQIAMNVEVFDSNLFRQYCPGKHALCGQTHIFNALIRAAEILGEGQVFSIFVGGLEELGSLRRGIEFTASHNVVPVINVFHPDPETPLSAHPRPTPNQILAMGRCLQSIYSQRKFRPFYGGCGRNSVDNEAFLQLFDECESIG
jgi:hypothetical protein